MTRIDGGMKEKFNVKKVLLLAKYEVLKVINRTARPENSDRRGGPQLEEASSFCFHDLLLQEVQLYTNHRNHSPALLASSMGV